MAETIGSLVDKISIIELRRWHTEGLMMSSEATVDERLDFALRLRIVDEQRDQLVRELDTLWAAIMSGEHPAAIQPKLALFELEDVPPPPEPSSSDVHQAEVVPFRPKSSQGGAGHR